MSKIPLTFALAFCLGLICVAQTQQGNTNQNNRTLQNTSETNSANNKQSRKKVEKGVVQLQVELLENGEIGKVVVLKAKKKMYEYGLVDKAIEAAKKIKFIPAKKDGKPTSQVKTVEYNFTITD